MDGCPQYEHICGSASALTTRDRSSTQLSWTIKSPGRWIVIPIHSCRFLSGLVLGHLAPGFLSLICRSGSQHAEEYTVHTNKEESMNPGGGSHSKSKKSTMVEADFKPASV